MTILDYTRNYVSLLIGGSTTGSIGYFMLGSGSGTVVATQDSFFNPFDKQAVTSITHTTNKISWQGDWSTTEVSGLQLQEFGMVTSGTGVTGSAFSKIIIPAITFDGTQELRITETWEVF